MNRQYRFVFVVGAQGSGTTVLTRILSGPECAIALGGNYVTIPRDDFALNHLDLGPVPAAAGIESSFHFFLCPCGKTSVMGQFVLQEHEINDVIDELRAAHIKVASMAPMMLNSQPRLSVLRFHGEGDVENLAKTLKAALEWTGWAGSAAHK